MKILTVNCGSSTLKFELLEIAGEAPSPALARRLAKGLVDRIGGRAVLEFQSESGGAVREPRTVSDHARASSEMLDWLDRNGLIADGLGAVGHRVIHGGYRFEEPAIIDDEVIAAIEALSGLAPLHNQPALEAIRATRARLGNIPMVAVFDTAFHRTMPERARRYAIPYELADKHHILRYGFHGLAHRYMMERYCAIASMQPDQIKIITLQLGNGCSATAIKYGRSIDTSMGLTPLEGLIMGTRSGDVDPSLAGFLARRENADVGTVEDWLNRKSGLLGISGQSRDMRELMALNHQGNKRATLAVDMFCYRIKKYLGAYMAALDGAEAVIFGGGIGENQPEIRALICSGMEWCGLKLDSERNIGAVGRESRISSEDSKTGAYVIPVDEAFIIARDTFSCLNK